MNQDLSIIQLVLHASFVVQLVMVGLLAVSLVSWSMIFGKVFGLIGKGIVKPGVDHTYPLAKAVQALLDVEAGGAGLVLAREQGAEGVAELRALHGGGKGAGGPQRQRQPGDGLERALVVAVDFGVLQERDELAAIAGGGLGGGGGGGGVPSQSAPSYDPAVEYQKGTTAFGAADYRAAAGHFKKVVSVVPKEAGAQYLLGASYMGLGEFKKAAKPLEMAVKYNAQLIEAKRDLAITHAKLGKADKAQPQLDALRAMQTTCATTCADAAKLTDAIAKVEAAIAGGKQASAATPDIKLAEAKAADQTYVTAVSLINEKRYEAAIAYLNDARWAAGPHPDILTYLGFANRKLKRFDEAEGYYQAALEIFPEHRGALEYYGELKLERGNVSGAKAHLAKLEAICGFGCNEADELRRWIAEKAPSAT